MSILITGGLGVIGSRLAAALRAAGHDVLVTDKAILKRAGYQRADITRYEELAPVFSHFKPKHVFHLAGEVGRENGEQFPRRCIEINESGTFNLAQLCRENGARLYFASTSEIYGKLGEKKITEDLADTLSLRPTNIYGWSKLHAENYIRHMVENDGLEALSYRFFMCYGPGEFPNPFRSAMANFIDRLRRDQSIEVHRGTKRSWCYIDDIVSGMIASMAAPFHCYEAYNLGCDDVQRMEDVARLICTMLGKPASLVRLVAPPAKYLTPVKDASFEKANGAFGFAATVPLGVGVQRTIDWQVQNVPLETRPVVAMT